MRAFGDAVRVKIPIHRRRVAERVATGKAAFSGEAKFFHSGFVEPEIMPEFMQEGDAHLIPEVLWIRLRILPEIVQKQPNAGQVLRGLGQRIGA